MNQDILLSKIVPNSTDSTWAQAYTTLNVYITLSIESNHAKASVTTHGKELLEKLQREFFALDDKSLENIKKAVGNVTKTIEPDCNYSMIVGAIVGDVLYIVIGSTGQVVIKRNDSSGVIATGVEGELHGFSGKLKHDDVIVFETGDFAKKLPLTDLSEYLDSSDVAQIAENITPIIHESAKGTECAIIIQYKNLSDIQVSEEKDFPLGNNKEEDEIEDDQKEVVEEQYSPQEIWGKEPHDHNGIEELSEEEHFEEEEQKEKKSLIPSFKMPKFAFGKKTIILGIVVLLITVLVGSIAYSGYLRTQQQNIAEFNKVFQPAKEKYDEGEKLESLNKSLALEDYNASATITKAAISKFSKSSTEYQKLSELQSKIDAKIASLGGGSSAKNIKEFLKPGGDLKSITAITAKGGTLLVLDKTGKQVATIGTDGKVKKTYDIKEGDSYISSDDKFIYTMGDAVTSIDRGNGDVKQLFKDTKGTSFDIFGSNIYALSGSDILKYKAPAYEEASYFTDKPSFKSTPTDISISGPIWVLEANGGIERFTKGKNDDIELSGLTGAIASGAKIYADPDNTNVYVMDVKNQRVVVLNDKGEYQTQYEGSFIKDGISFAIDEKNKVGYVLSGNLIYSFDL